MSFLVFDLANPLYQSFVHPDLCRQLVEAGIKSKTLFWWELTNEHMAELNTHCFDPENVYRQATANIDYIHKKQRYPAFTINDLEKLLPDYMVERIGTDRGYQIVSDASYQLEGTTATRFPDVFAKLALNAIRKRILDPEKATYIINSQNQQHA